MHKTIRIFAIGALLIGSGIACAQPGGTLEKIKKTHAVTIGHRESSVPFSYYDRDQQVIGYANDICLHVVEAIRQRLSMPDIKIVYAPVTSSNRIPLLANGTIDLECGSTANLPDRWRQVAFSNTYFLTGTKFLAKKSSHLDTIASLKGSTVASTAGTENLKYLHQANQKLGLDLNIIAANDHAEGFLMVETGRAAAFVLDDVLLASLIASSKDPDGYMISEEEFAPAVPYGVMVRRNDPEFKKLVDDATAQLYRSPAMKALYDKWFTSPIPPRDINLRLPMSKALARALAAPTDTSDLAHYSK